MPFSTQLLHEVTLILICIGVGKMPLPKWLPIALQRIAAHAQMAKPIKLPFRRACFLCILVLCGFWHFHPYNFSENVGYSVLIKFYLF